MATVVHSNHKAVNPFWNHEEANMSSQVFSQVERITPDRAAEILESGASFNNRNVAEGVVRRYAHDMANGKWKMTGEAIRFNQNGELIDGQHRLYAVIESGATIETLVIYGLTNEAFHGLDRQRRRNAAQFLGMHGYINENVLAATIKQILRYHILGDFRAGRELQAPLGFDDYLSFAQETPEVTEAVKVGAKRQLEPLAGRASLYAALYFLFRKTDEEDADVFFDLLTSGAGLEDRGPILVLRNTLIKIKQQLKGASAEPNYVAALFIKAWNAWRAGETISILRYKPGGANPDKFPKIR